MSGRITGRCEGGIVAHDDAVDGMTVEEMVVALLRTRDPHAIPEFTADGETWWRVTSIDKQADGNVTMEVESW